MKGRYWFYIENYVHVNVKKDRALLYNPYRKKILEYFNPIVLDLLRKLKISRNMGVVSLNEQILKNPAIKNFIFEVRMHFMGDLLEKRFSKGKPIVMTPIVKVQQNIDYIEKNKSRSIGENIMEYISEIFIYVNSSCSNACDICKTAFRQIACCTTEQIPIEIALEKLKIFLLELTYSPLKSINILGGDLTEYKDFEKILGVLKNFKCRKMFWLHYLNIAKSYDKLDMFNIDNSWVLIPINFPLHEKDFQNAIDAVYKKNFKAVPIFIVQSNEDFRKAELKASEMKLENCEFIPFYNGRNDEFFEENVFLSSLEIESIAPALNEIYSNSLINTANFGKLTVTTDGKVYANINNKSIGELGKRSIYEMLIKELRTKKSWRLTRKEVFPCKNCSFEFLCPPISNYNRLMGHNNMYTIWKTLP